MTAVFHPEKLHNCLKKIAVRFPLTAETIRSGYHYGCGAVISDLCAVDERNLTAYVAALSGRDVELILLSLTKPLKMLQLERALKALSIRAGHRLAALAWALLQFHYEESQVLQGTWEIYQHCSPAVRQTPEARNLLHFIDEGGLSYFTDDLLREKKLTATAYFAREKFIENSPLAFAVVLRYFTFCGATGYFFNQKRFMRMISAATDEQLTQMLENYLQKLEPSQYLYDANDLITARWGAPLISSDWEGLPMALREKFAEWNSLRLLGTHFIKSTKKYRLLADYIPYFRDLTLQRDSQTLVIDFGDFFLIDDEDASPVSYLIRLELYEKVRGQFEQNGFRDFLGTLQKIPEARDFIIDESDGDFLQLNYNDVGKLYIIDVLNILLGLAPDLRGSKRLISQKQFRRNQAP